jgi:hypothetical protein
MLDVDISWDYSKLRGPYRFVAVLHPYDDKLAKKILRFLLL